MDRETRSKMYENMNRIVLLDVAVVQRKNEEYNNSWIKRGGVGAFMMLARKWDRMEEQVLRHHYDIIKACAEDRREEGLLDDIRDLRRYLGLLEAYIMTTVLEEERALDAIIGTDKDVTTIGDLNIARMVDSLHGPHPAEPDGQGYVDQG